MTGFFAPAVLGGIRVRNHFIRSATMEGEAAEDGRPTQAIADLYTGLADEGVGTIITSYIFIADYEQPQPGEMGIYRDDLIPDYRVLANLVHRHGGRIVMQLVHGSSVSQAHPWSAVVLGPSAIANPDSGIIPKEMTPEDIRHVEGLFADAAGRAKEAGFDGVEIHAAHGYLLSQFMSPLLNHRRDAYGGTVENRYRMVHEVYQAVRERVGTEYPVWIKMNSSDEIPGGLSAEDFLWMGKQLDAEGIDAIEVSGGRWYAHPGRDRLYYLDAAAGLQKEISANVILTGGIRDRADLEKAASRGVYFYGFARPFLMRPDFLQTLKATHEGREAGRNGKQ